MKEERKEGEIKSFPDKQKLWSFITMGSNEHIWKNSPQSRKIAFPSIPATFSRIEYVLGITKFSTNLK